MVVLLAVAVAGTLRHRGGDDVEHVAGGRGALARTVRGGQLDRHGGAADGGDAKQRGIVADGQQRANLDLGGVGGADGAGEAGDAGRGDAATSDLVLQPFVLLLVRNGNGLEVGDEARLILDDGRKNVREVALLVLETVGVQHVFFSYDKIPLRCREKLNFLRV
ncbi:MAG: hypothetical protein L6W00_12100 [Lentisphaeria bacterium]|nr:MAG: hypothetical protein L6W00_12100 [Lentisphaeria bacterium]